MVMKEIDTTKWKEYKIEDLFVKLDLKFKKTKFNKHFDISEEKNAEFNLPLVNAKHSNNGIMYYGRESDFDSSEMTIDIVEDGAASTGDVYPQPQRTGVLYNAYLIKSIQPINSAMVLFFISTVLQRCIKEKFGYDNKCTWKRVKKEYIKLPTNSVGNPDFVYMEDYMKDVFEKTKKRLNKQLEINQEKKTLSSNDWCDFQVGDLFKKVELKIKKGSFDKKFDVSEVKTEEFNLPLVNAKHFNNGIMYYGRKSDFEYENMTLDVVQNGAIATGDVYVQPQDTGVLWDAYLLKPLFDTNEHVLRFIATSLRKTLKEKYGYDDKCTWEKVKLEFIKLPAVSADTPDFAYMENYMKGILAKQRANLDVLCSL